MSFWFLSLLLLSNLPHYGRTLHWKIHAWDKRCFVEDAPDNTMITYEWELRLFNDGTGDYDKGPSENGNMHLTITSSQTEADHANGDTTTGTVRHEQDLTNGYGVIKFFAADYGLYEWCFKMKGINGPAMGKFYVKSTQQYQDDADEMEEVIAETQDQIISYLSKSLRTAKHVKMEQKHYEAREQEFRSVSYLTSARVVWYGAITALTVVSTGCFLMMNLRSFFIAKKLV